MKRIDVYGHNKRFPELDPDDIFKRRPWKYSFDWSLGKATDRALFSPWPYDYHGNGLWHFKLEGLLEDI